MKPKGKIVYTIIRLDGSMTEPFGLLDETGTLRLVADRVGTLSDYAFDQCGADEVRHDEDLK